MATSVEGASNEVLAEAGGPPTSSSTSSSGGHVLLKDVGHLVRLGIVAVPSGFTKLGHPVLFLPDVTEDNFATVLESDLHLLFKVDVSIKCQCDCKKKCDQGPWMA